MKDGDDSVREVISELHDKIDALSNFVDLYAGISESIYSFDLNRQGSFISVQSKKKEISQFKNIRFLDLVTHNDRKQAADLFVRCLSGEQVHGTLKIITPSGNPIPIQIAALPRRRNKSIVGVQGVALQETTSSPQELHSSIVHLLRVPSCITDLVGNIVSVNESFADFLETEPKQLVETHLTDWIDDQDIVILQDKFREALHDQPVSLQAHVVAVSGIKIPAAIEITDLPEEGHLLCMFNKLTAQKHTPILPATEKLKPIDIIDRVESICSVQQSTFEDLAVVCQNAVAIIVDTFSPDVCYIGLIEDGAVHVMAGHKYEREYIALSEECPPCTAISSAEVQYATNSNKFHEINLPLIKDNTSFGVINIKRAYTEFTDEEQLLLQLLSGQIAQAVIMARSRADMYKYKNIFDKALEGIYRTTIEGNILEANPTFLEMFGYTGHVNELKSITADKLYANPDERQKLVHKLQEEGTLENFETSYIMRNKKKFYGRESAWMVRDGDRIIIEGMIQDISLQKKLEEDATFYNSLLRHDIYNKNEIAIGYLGLLRTNDLTAKDEDIINKVVTAITEGNKLIETVKKLETIKDKRDMKNILLDDVINRIIATYEAESKQQDIDINYASSGAIVRGNDLIEDIFSNLLKNSIQHSYAEHITIYAEDNVQGWNIFVEDDGVGISPDQKEKIFHQGWRGKGSKGSGLGLYLVKKIVQGFGGKIFVESGKDEFPGGTRFIVWLCKGKKNNRIIGQESDALGVRW